MIVPESTPERPTVELTAPVVYLTKCLAEMRQQEAIKQGRPDVYGFDGDGWSIHLSGALGEEAFAKWRGCYPDRSLNRFKRVPGDIAGYEIRCRSRHDWDLYVRKDDPDNAVFVLVVHILDAISSHPGALTFRLPGWMTAVEAKRVGWWGTRTYNRPPMFWVRQSQLHPMTELPELS